MLSDTKSLWAFLEDQEHTVVYAGGDTVLRQGDVGGRMHVVLSGSVDFRHAGQPLERLGVGGLFGELALIDGEPRGASAVAAEVCSLAIVGRERFELLLTEQPAFALEVMRVMADRLRRRTVDATQLAGFLRQNRVPATLANRDESLAVGGPVADEEKRRRDRLLRELGAKGSGQRSLVAGDKIFEEGDPGDEMFVVAEGEVEIRTQGRLLETLGVGGVFGELSVIEPGKRSASAEALSDTRLVSIGRDRFQLLARYSPAFAVEVLKVVADRLRLRTQDCGRLAVLLPGVL